MVSTGTRASSKNGTLSASPTAASRSGQYLVQSQLLRVLQHPQPLTLGAEHLPLEPLELTLQRLNRRPECLYQRNELRRAVRSHLSLARELARRRWFHQHIVAEWSRSMKCWKGVFATTSAADTACAIYPAQCPPTSTSIRSSPSS